MPGIQVCRLSSLLTADVAGRRSNRGIGLCRVGFSTILHARRCDPDRPRDPEPSLRLWERGGRSAGARSSSSKNSRGPGTMRWSSHEYHRMGGCRSVRAVPVVITCSSGADSASVPGLQWFLDEGVVPHAALEQQACSGRRASGTSRRISTTLTESLHNST